MVTAADHGSGAAAEGCRCNRATVELVQENGLKLVELDTASWHFMPPIIRPLVTGVAVKNNPVP
jgi:hypothetical protein